MDGSPYNPRIKRTRLAKACHFSGFLTLRSLFNKSTFIRVQLMRNVVIWLKKSSKIIYGVHL
jgi:hypothetical protein